MLESVYQAELAYLWLADKRLGLLINLHVARIKDGIARIVNRLEERVSRKVARTQSREKKPLLMNR